MPQVVEVLKYVHEVVEHESLGIALTGDIAIAEKRYRDLYGVTKKQLDIVLTELKRIRTSQPALAGVIELLERYALDFDRLAAAQRIVPVDRDVIVEKEIAGRSVLVPVKDSESIRNELAHSVLIEKLLTELKRVKKTYNNVKFELGNDVSLFFPELEGGNKPAGNFQDLLNQYTKDNAARFNSFSANWANDHQLIIHTVLQERFAMADLIRQANI